MKREEFERMIESVEVIPHDGLIKFATEEGIIEYRIDAMYQYCQYKRELDSPKELTEREWNQFIVKENQPRLYNMPKKLDEMNFMECCECGSDFLVNDLDPVGTGISCARCQSTKLVNRGMASDVKIEKVRDDEICGSDELKNAVIIERYEDYWGEDDETR